MRKTRPQEYLPINNQIMPIDQTHPRRTQKHHNITHFIHMRLPALSSFILFPSIALQHTADVLGRNGFEKVGLQEPWGDGVDSDVVLAGFE